MNVQVRRALATDGPGLYAAWIGLRRHYAGVDRRVVLVPVSENEFVGDLTEALSRGTATTFVAVDGGRVVGFASGSIEPGQEDRLPKYHATVGYVYVEASYRRAGIGRRLFDAVAAWAASFEGVSHVEMAVLSADRGAESFWRGLGFSPFIQRLWAPLGVEGPR